MARDPNKLSAEAKVAMETVRHSGLWEERYGEIIIGIDDFNGYALTAGAV